MIYGMNILNIQTPSYRYNVKLYFDMRQLIEKCTGGNGNGKK